MHPCIGGILPFSSIRLSFHFYANLDVTFLTDSLQARLPGLWWEKKWATPCLGRLAFMKTGQEKGWLGTNALSSSPASASLISCRQINFIFLHLRSSWFKEVYYFLWMPYKITLQSSRWHLWKEQRLSRFVVRIQHSGTEITYCTVGPQCCVNAV